MVGSNVDEEHFRVLKIDRSEPRELVLHDDGTVYTKAEFLDLLKMIEVGNRTKVGQRMGSGLNKTMSSYGIIGFVRFLEGYYIYLITKRLKVAMVGHHSIYKIEDTAMIYIPNDEVIMKKNREIRYCSQCSVEISGFSVAQILREINFKASKRTMIQNFSKWEDKAKI